MDKLRKLICLNLGKLSENSKITEIKGLEKLIKLENLNLSKNKIGNIINLKHNLKLKYLNLSKNENISIEGNSK